MPLSATVQQGATRVDECLSCLYSIDWLEEIKAINWFEEIKAIDWYNEIRLVATAILLAAIIVPIIVFVSSPNAPIWHGLGNFVRLPDWLRLPNWIWLRNLVIYFNLLALLRESELPDRPGRRTIVCPPTRMRSNPYEPSHRTRVGDENVRVYAWPSKGGAIILDHVETVDLEFLGLDPLNPPAKRLASQIDEDVFCQRLLLLGAKWWDSEARFNLLTAVMSNEEYEAEEAIKILEEEPIPSIKERRWVSVAWPTTGGLWVAEFDTTMEGIIEEYNLVPFGIARLKLARTMDERSEILRTHFKATYYKELQDYEGYTFLNSWEQGRPEKEDS